jgi:hypothetical protein
MDKQELTEREEYAASLIEENPQHFVGYVEECVKESKESTKDIRQVWKETWLAHEMKIDYSDKEDWQAKAVTADPFVTVQQAKAVVRRALMRPDYFDIAPQGEEDSPIADIIKKGMNFWLTPHRANFPIMFVDACEMGLTTGQSMEVIPQWIPRTGLVIDLVAPWKIYRDPDAIPRDPQSGMYWIHEEWLDIWQLKADGSYQNINNLTGGGKPKEAEEEKQLTDKYWERSKYRKGVQVREFWGTVLDPQGDLLLENCRFTVAADQIIKPPEDSGFVKIRWPGVSFSPFPHLLRFEGRGILEGVISLWWMICNLLNLDADNFAWVINKIREIDPSMMADPGDTELYPGKDLIKKPGAAGPIIGQVDTGVANTADVLGRFNYWQQKWDNNSLTPEFVTGIPSARKGKVTATETEIKTQQSLGVWDSVGRDIELGAMQVLWVCLENIILNWDNSFSPSPARALGEENAELAIKLGMMDDVTRRRFLREGCDVKVSGISAELQQLERLEKIGPFMDRAESPAFAPYFKPYELLKEEAQLRGFYDPSFLMSEEDVKAMRTMQAEDVWNTLAPEQQQAIGAILKDLLQGGKIT